MSEPAITTAYGSPFVATGPQQASAEGAAGRSYHNIGHKLFVQTIGAGGVGGSGATGVLQQSNVLPDHAAATVAALQRIIDKLNAGTSPEDLGRDVELLGRIMARRT